MAPTFYLKVDDVTSKICLGNEDFTIGHANDEIEEDCNVTIVAIDDIVSIQNDKSSSVEQDATSNVSMYISSVVHFIKRNENSKWTKESITITCTDDKSDEFLIFCTNLHQRFDKIAALRPKRLLVLMNAIGGK